MRRIATVLLCLATLAARAQDAEIPIRGTNVLLTPPEHFAPAKTFRGLEGDEAYIEVMELGSDFQFMRNNFALMCKQEGYTIYEEKDTTVNGYSARYYSMASEPEVMVRTVVFGDHSFTVMIKGSYPVDEDQVGADIKAALLGAHYRKQPRRQE